MAVQRSFKTLLLDLDGTLLGARQFPVFALFSARMLRRFHAQSGSLRTSLRAYAGLQRAVLAGDSSRTFTNAHRAAREFARMHGLTPEDADALLQAWVAEVFPTLRPHFFPIAGAREFVDWARSRYPLILATAPVWKEPIIRLRLDWAGIDPKVFAFITHSERMYATKPDPIYYEDVLAQGGLDPATTLLVGDDPANDLPAVRVGIPVFMISSRGPETPIPLDDLPDQARAPAWRGNWEALRALLSSS